MTAEDDGLAAGQGKVLGLFAVATFFAAFLLFAVQPLAGRLLLPVFGGTPSVWTTCLMFFQVGLFGGYLWAHWGAVRLRLRTQVVVHLGLLGAAVFVLPIVTPTAGDSGEGPRMAVLGWLAVAVGAPYFVLAGTAPLLQRWLEQRWAIDPYRLYAVSNAGSLVALGTYPFLVEPWVGLPGQAWMWTLGFGLFAGLMLVVTVMMLRGGEARAQAGSGEAAATRRVPWRRRFLWLGLTAVPSVMLLAVTSYITVDVAAGPLLWVLPLFVYLLSFVLVFRTGKLRHRSLFLAAWALCTATFGISVFMGADASLAGQLIGALAGLFVCCMLCHGELVRLRPEPGALTSFYVWLAGGGALGGVLAGLVAPQIFAGLYELPAAVLGTYVLLMLSLRADGPAGRGERRWLYLGVGVAVPVVAGALWVQTADRVGAAEVLHRDRGFFGAIRVTRLEDATVLTHGRIQHGMQWNEDSRRAEPTMYFGPGSAVGAVLSNYRRDQARKVGVLGLGVGTLAAYGREGERFRFYEINPEVVAVAKRHFSFLEDSAAAVEIAVGDGRILLADEPDQGFDVLVLDAFASDAVPIHLLTVEAFSHYRRHMASGGILVANVSNHHLDVDRAVAGAAREQGLVVAIVQTSGDAARGYTRVRWAVMAEEKATLDVALDGLVRAELSGPAVVWTDDRSSLLGILR